MKKELPFSEEEISMYSLPLNRKIEMIGVAFFISFILCIAFLQSVGINII